MTSSLEDLLQNIFRDPRVESTNVERSLVWFWSCAPAASACRRSDVVFQHLLHSIHLLWERTDILRDVEWWWHVALRAILEACLTRHGRREGRRCRSRVRHVERLANSIGE